MTQPTTQTILISGCPRSGTSWLQFLVASHPDVVSSRETHLYDKYLGPMRDWFAREDALLGRDGLSRLFSEDAFEKEILIPIVQTVWDRIRLRKPEAPFLVEKTPGNILHHRLIRRLQPDARMLFIVRDPRAVVASFKAAGRQAWGGWASKPLSDVCDSWNNYNSAFVAARGTWEKKKIHALRFERLRNETVGQLRSVFVWAGMKYSSALLESIIADNQISKFQNAGPDDTLRGDSRKDFYRNGTTDGWTEDLTLAEIREVEQRCTHFMEYWGYARYVPDQGPRARAIPINRAEARGTAESEK